MERSTSAARERLCLISKRELKTGTLHAILKQLGLTLDDLR